MTRVFVYGSLHPHRLAELLDSSHVKKPRGGVLKGYRRVYAGKSKRWGNGGVAGLEKCASRNVRGLIYDLNKTELECLDKWETDVYERKAVDIDVGNGHTEKCHAYFFVESSRPYHPPHDSYRHHVNKLLTCFQDLKR